MATGRPAKTRIGGAPAGKRDYTKRLDDALRFLWSICRDNGGNCAVGNRIVDLNNSEGGRSTAISPFVEGAHALISCLPRYVFGLQDKPSLQTVAEHARKVIPAYARQVAGRKL